MFKSPNAKKIASNTAFQLIGKVLSTAVTLAVTVIITRMYGREEYGAFSLMQSFPALVFIVVDFGINAVAVREISKDGEKLNLYLSNVFILRVVFSAVLMLIMAFVLIFLPYSSPLKTGILLSLLLILTQALYSTTNIVFQTKFRYDLSTIGYITGSLSILLLVIILSVFKVNIIWISFSYVVGGVVTFLVNMRYLKELGAVISWKLDYGLCKFLLTQALPLGFMFVFSQVNFKSDAILLSILDLPARFQVSGTEAVAIYNLPYKVFEVSLVLPTFFMNSVYPIFVTRMGEGKERLKETFYKSLKVLCLSGVLIGIAGFLVAPLAVQILGGGQFLQSILVMRILFGGLAVFYISQPISWLIVTLGRQSSLPAIYLISAVFNVVLNVAFIPRYAFYASSVITILSEMLILVLLVFSAVKIWRNYNVS